MSTIERLREIFPTKGHSVFFLTYVLLYIFNGKFVCLSMVSLISSATLSTIKCLFSCALLTGILIRLSRRSGESSYDYDTTSVVLVTELTKLTIACVIFLYEGHTVVDLFRQMIDNRHLALFYLIPAVLYCIYNNLTYVSLSYFDPTSYYILLQVLFRATTVFELCLFLIVLCRFSFALPSPVSFTRSSFSVT